MIPLSLREIALIVGGSVLNATGEEVVSGDAFIDSRNVALKGLFVALSGEHVDGHQFAKNAIQNGAIACLVTRDVGVPSVQVKDAELSLQLLAGHIRRVLPNLKTIGITGSQGKTTTKDLLFAILSKVSPTIAPPGSFNNELGVPLTILRCSEETRFCILEMGARHQGDIAKLAKLANLDIGAVLNIGTAHIGEFGSLSILAKAKGEMIASLSAGAGAVLGTYDAETTKLGIDAPCRVVTFGENPDSVVRATEISLIHGQANFQLVQGTEGVSVQLNYYGRHQVANALGAAAIAAQLRIGLPIIAEALSGAHPISRWRMEVSQSDGVTIINDAYNANPESMSAAIELLAEWSTSEARPSWAILGQMHELGASSDQAHRLIGRLVAERGIDHLIVVGSGASEIWNGAQEMVISDARLVTDAESALRHLQQHLEPNAMVLVKASRAEGLEKLALEISGGKS